MEKDTNNQDDAAAETEVDYTKGDLVGFKYEGRDVEGVIDSSDKFVLNSIECHRYM